MKGRPMKTVARKLSFAASPLVLAVALGLLAPNVLLDEDGDAGAVRDDAGAADAGLALDGVDLADDVAVERA